MLNDWRDCALEKECISPEGSNRTNHRQDQSVLSILAHLNSLGKSCRPKFEMYGMKASVFIKTHRDDAGKNTVLND